MVAVAMLGLNLFLFNLQDNALDAGLKRMLRVRTARSSLSALTTSTNTLSQLDSGKLIGFDKQLLSEKAELSSDALTAASTVSRDARLRKTKSVPPEVKTNTDSRESLDAAHAFA
jgi:hypothetical protein